MILNKSKIVTKLNTQYEKCYFRLIKNNVSIGNIVEANKFYKLVRNCKLIKAQSNLENKEVFEKEECIKIIELLKEENERVKGEGQ